MANFSTANAGPRPAPKRVPLPPSMFIDTWDKKPSDTIEAGLRLVSEGDIERARAEAFKRAMEFIPEPGQDRVDAFNDAVMRHVVAYALCMPEDAREAFFPLPEEDCREALTSEAIAFLWHEYDVLKIESCEYLHEATDEELTELACLLNDDQAWGALTVEKAKRLKRIAFHLLEELDPEFRE